MRVSKEEKKIIELEDENKQLKKLLKECRELIDKHIVGEYVVELCDRIDNIVDEKK